MNRARTVRLTVSLLLALVVVALGGVSVARKVQAFQPLGFVGRATQGGIQVERADPQTGLRQGDLLLLLLQNGEIAGQRALTEHLRGQAVSVLPVLRGLEVVQVTYKRPPLQVDVPYLILSLIGVLFLLIGLYTLVRKSDRQGFLFALWALTSAAFYLLSAVPPVDVVFQAVYLGDEIARLLLPALTLHLFLVFPAALPRAPRWPLWNTRLIPFLYLPGAVLFALQLQQIRAAHASVAALRLLDRAEMAQLGIYALAAVAMLVYRLLHERGWEQQRQLQWMVFGMGGGYLPFLLLYGIPDIFGLRGPVLLQAVSVLPLALVPLTFAYAILRYKLWDIEVIVRDTISMTLTLLLGVIGFSLVNLAITRGLAPELGMARNLLMFMAGLAIAGLLVPTRTGISSALERLQYRGSFGRRRALTELGRELLHERDLGRLCAALLQEIESGVDLERANLLLAQGGVLAAFRPEPGLSDPSLANRLPFDILGDELWGKDFVRLSGMAMPGQPATPEQRLFLAGYRYAFPLEVRGRGVGIVLAGLRQGSTPLNSDDTELIRQLLNQAALAIENAQLVGQLHFQLEEVRTLQRYTEGIFESSPAGIAVLDPEHRVLSANAAFAALCGSERGILIGRELAELLPVAPLPTPGEGPVEVSTSDAAGRERHLQVSLAVFEGPREGESAGGALRVLVVHDVSERVAMENELKEKDRLAALGMLAAGVAHEVNTPITGISSYAQMLLSDTAESDPHYEILKKVERQTFRAARIVNNLLEFARNRQKERKPMAVAPILRECVDLLADRLEKRRITLAWDLADETAMVMGCEGELQQVFTNLLVNALDAVCPTAACAAVGKGRITVGLEAAEASLRVKIQDNGPGIPAEKLDAIFQPFYSTKLNRGGTGLGLSISFDIVRRHGGTLRAVSQPGEGACFVVELPRHPSSTALPASSTPV